MNENEQTQHLREENERLRRSRDKFLSFYRGLERDLEELKNRYNELNERFKRLEQENRRLQCDKEYYQNRAYNFQQQAETLQSEKRRNNLSENF